MAVVPRVETLENFQRWRTDAPIEEIWKFLLIFADIGYLKKRWSTTEASLVAVSTMLRQAHEYHLASRTVSLLTRPLLIYYSMLNLAKAAIYIVTDVPPFENHGLCSSRMADRLTDCSGQARSGVFQQLCRIEGLEIPSKRRLSFEDFVANLLEMEYASRDYLGRQSEILRPKVTSYFGGKVEIHISKAQAAALNIDPSEAIKGRSDLLKDFNETETVDEILLTSKISWDGDDGRQKRRELVARHVTFGVFPGQPPFLCLLPHDRKLPRASSYFGAMWLLSEIVRYEPQYVDRFLRGGDDSVEWYVREVCDMSERVFPNLMIDLITRGSHRFGASL
jgi:YaaC-like protein